MSWISCVDLLSFRNVMCVFPLSSGISFDVSCGLCFITNMGLNDLRIICLRKSEGDENLLQSTVYSYIPPTNCPRGYKAFFMLS